MILLKLSNCLLLNNLNNLIILSTLKRRAIKGYTFNVDISNAKLRTISTIPESTIKKSN